MKLIGMLGKRDQKLLSLQEYLNQQIFMSKAWDRKKTFIWMHRQKKLQLKLPESLNCYLVKNFL
jgi:hypothetical protein